MTRSTRLLTAAMTASLGLSLAVGLPPALTAGAATAEQGRPPVGACYNLTAKQIQPMSSQVTSVPCSRTHTTVTVAVTNLPPDLSFTSPQKKLDAAVDKICYPPVAKAVGGGFVKYSQTLYGFAFFYPTAAQQKAGARWVRCDVDYGTSEYKSVRPIPGNTRPIVKHAIPRTALRCADQAKKQFYVACDKPHAYRAVGSFLVAGRYQTEAAYSTSVQQHCPKFDKNKSGFGLRGSENAWLAGDHAIVCFTKSKH